jgi:hypothetical protein
VLSNLFIGCIGKYTFKNQQDGGKRYWSIIPLDLIVVGNNAYAKKISRFHHHLGLDSCDQPH